MIRWQAKAIYRTEAGPVDITHNLQEIADLHGLIERGPHWDAVIRIEIIRVNHCENKTLTVEEAQRL